MKAPTEEPVLLLVHRKKHQHEAGMRKSTACHSRCVLAPALVGLLRSRRCNDSRGSLRLNPHVFVTTHNILAFVIGKSNCSQAVPLLLQL